MKLKNILDISKGDIVSIVGAGGKTTLMYSLAEELRYEHRVLVTTTTKIYMPEKECYDFLNIGENSFNNNIANGIYLQGKFVNEENKIIGLSDDIIEKEVPYFDYILIEADGSKKKIIKGWNDTEPVIISKTSKTIGIINIEAIGKVINADNVHRVEQFLHITASKGNESITIEHLSSLIFHPKGLFKESKGEKILFVNRVEGPEKTDLTYKLLSRIKEKNQNYLDKIIIGSLKNKQILKVKG